MTTTKTKIASIVAGSALVMGAAPVAAIAVDTAAEKAPDAQVATAEKLAGQQAQKKLAEVSGTFAWNQDVVAGNDTLAKNLYAASDYLCASGPQETSATRAAAVGDAIALTGDVRNSFTASIAEYKKVAPVKKIMGCTCYGNPSDGRASANAEVEGFQLKALIADAQPAKGANTITFTCADGYKVALPLSYVTQRYSIIVTGINGEEASEAVGCSNQLWLGSTSARSFARDIVGISITAEANPPAAPGAAAATPNVAVTGAKAS